MALALLATLALLSLCSATLIVSPASGPLAIPYAYVGYSAVATISVQNPSNSTFSITSTAFGTPGAPWSSQVSSTVVSANTTSSIFVLLTATTSGPASNTFSFTTDDPAVPSAQYNVSATVLDAPPILTATPSYRTLYFGDGSPDSHNTHPATISFNNDGTSPLVVSASITGQDPLNFAVSPSSFQINPNTTEPLVVTVSCSASVYGELLAVLNFQTNDPLWPTYTYTLSCWSVHMGKDVAIGFVILFVFWLVFAILLWALFAFKQ